MSTVSPLIIRVTRTMLYNTMTYLRDMHTYAREAHDPAMLEDVLAMRQLTATYLVFLRELQHDRPDDPENQVPEMMNCVAHHYQCIRQAFNDLPDQ